MPLGGFGPGDGSDVQPPEDREEHLPGAVGAVRVGSTVRKTAGPWTPTIHALLHIFAGTASTWRRRPSGSTIAVGRFCPGSMGNRPTDRGPLSFARMRV